MSPGERAGAGDLPGEIEQVRRAGELHRERELGRPRSSPRPAATASAISPDPERGPERRAGSFGRKPNAAPDAQRRMLFGPGVTELTNENAIRAPSVTGFHSAIDGSRPGRYEARGCGSCTILRWTAPPTAVSVRAWKPPSPGIREVFHARFTEHAYPPHTHDDWTLFIVDDGAIRYDLDRRAAAPSPRWSRSCRRTSSTTAARRRTRLPEAGPLPGDERHRRGADRRRGRPPVLPADGLRAGLPPCTTR